MLASQHVQMHHRVWARRAFSGRAVSVPPRAVARKAEDPPRRGGADVDLKNPDSEAAQRAARIAKLKSQEKFAKIGTGEADCVSCGYHYDPKTGDPEYPVNPGCKFQDLPQDWICPVCGAEAKTFQVAEKEVAGFAVNQGYGFGTNSMTAGQKSLLIYGSLLFFFSLFILGYALQ